MFKKFFKVLYKVLITIFVLGSIGVGIVLLVGGVTGDERVENVVYGTKDKVVFEFDRLFSNIGGSNIGGASNNSDYVPVIYYGGSGGKYELDTAGRDTFIELEPYRGADIPPIIGSHSGLGGEQILFWEPGQKFRIVGSPYEGEWVVVDYRDIERFGSVGLIEGLQGDLGLQSCHRGVPLIRVAGAERIGD